MISWGRNWSDGATAKEHQVTSHHQKLEEGSRVSFSLGAPRKNKFC